MRILHFIDSLDYGGAETLLISYLPLLDKEKNFVVTLKGPNVYAKSNFEYIELNVDPKKGFIKAVFTIRKIILEKNIDIVHSHSFWTNIITRFATPRKTKLLNHYHFADYDTMIHKTAVKRMIIIDRLLSRKSLVRIAVSDYVAKILRKNFPKGNVKVISNFIDCNSNVFQNKTLPGNELKVIAVGNCNAEKNYPLVIEAFKLLKDEAITIDIYGGRGFLDFYIEEVNRLGLKNVRFCGSHANVRENMKNYDLFLSASKSETFGIAVLEGVCAKLPLLLSNIPAFKEIAPKCALFFDPYDKNDLVFKLKNVTKNNKRIVVDEYNKVLEKYSPNNFLSELRKIYNN